MEGEALSSIIGDQFDRILEKINANAENLILTGKTENQVKEIKEKIEQDKAELTAELQSVKKSIFDQYDSRINEINEILTDQFLDKKSQLENVKEKLFQNNFLFHISNNYFEEEFQKYIGVLIVTPFYLSEKEITKIK